MRLQQPRDCFSRQHYSGAAEVSGRTSPTRQLPAALRHPPAPRPRPASPRPYSAPAMPGEEKGSQVRPGRATQRAPRLRRGPGLGTQPKEPPGAGARPHLTSPEGRPPPAHGAAPPPRAAMAAAILALRPPPRPGSSGGGGEAVAMAPPPRPACLKTTHAGGFRPRFATVG